MVQSGGMSKDLVPYVALLAAVFLIYFPRVFVWRGASRQPEGFDNTHPRLQQAKLTGLAARAHAAHENGFEAFGPFAAGVLACKVAGVDADQVALLSMGFIALRVVYLVLYLRNLSTLRSITWAFAFLISLTLLALPVFA